MIQYYMDCKQATSIIFITVPSQYNKHGLETIAKRTLEMTVEKAF